MIVVCKSIKESISDLDTRAGPLWTCEFASALANGKHARLELVAIEKPRYEVGKEYDLLVEDA